MRRMRPVALDEYDEQPFRFAATVELAMAPAAVFAELADLAPWFPLMRSCAWRDAAGGVGAERDVTVLGLGTFCERMLAWDPDARVAFTMTATTTVLMDRMAEDWLIRRQADRTTLTWTVVGEPTPLGRTVAPALRAVLGLLFRRACRRLESRSTRA